MKLGIIGWGRSGKTTIFNAVTRREGESLPAGGQAAPVLGVVSVPDPRVEWLDGLYHAKRKVHAQVTYMDLQAMSGVLESMQQYMSLLLTHMRPVDAFMMVIRNFTDPVLGPPNAVKDFRELEEEFIIADLATVEKRLEKLALEEKKGRKVGVEKELLDACARALNEEKPLRLEPALTSAPELRGFTFLSAKPLLVIINNADDDDRLPAGGFDSAEVMVVRGKLEMEMAQLSDAEAEVFRADFGIGESALDRVIQRSYSLLHLITFLTVGEDEVKAWTIPQGMIAQEAAGVIHSDIQRGFIRAEVVAYDDLRRAGDHAAARKQGWVRLEGKTYEVKDGDVITFRFNV